MFFGKYFMASANSSAHLELRKKSILIFRYGIEKYTFVKENQTLKKAGEIKRV